MRKIDDDLLLDMYAEGRGKSQREIAVYFNVSPAAICKRLKRLSAPEMQVPESFSRLTEKQQKFVVEKVQGRTNIEAVKRSYDVTSSESAKSLGTTLMKDPDIETAIHDLMAQTGISKRYRIQRLRDLIDHRDGNISAKGLDMSFKLDGSYAPQHITAEIDHHQVTREIAELTVRLEEIRKQEEELQAEDEKEVEG